MTPMAHTPDWRWRVFDLTTHELLYELGMDLRKKRLRDSFLFRKVLLYERDHWRGYSHAIPGKGTWYRTDFVPMMEDEVPAEIRALNLLLGE